MPQKEFITWHKIECIQALALPPEEYYRQLQPLLQEHFAGAGPDFVEHAVLLIEAFDTATFSALSFGKARFQMARCRVKLVGDMVCREGRSPNPTTVRAIQNWPLARTLRDSQAFLGTTNYVRAHGVQLTPGGRGAALCLADAQRCFPSE